MSTINYTALEALEIKLRDIFKQTALYSLGIACIIFLGFVILSGSVSVDKFLDNAFPFFLISFFIFIGLFMLGQSFVSRRATIKAFKQFSTDNSLTFTDKPREDLRHAHFFSYGDSRKFSFCINSTQAQPPFSFFNFQYGITHRNGKGQATTTWYPFTIFVFQLQKSVPNIYIHNKNNQTIDEPFTEDQRLNINVNQSYENNHAVYAPKQYEIEALQILDASFVEKISQVASGYDIEFYDSKMFVYIPSNENLSSESLEGTKKLFALYDSLHQTLLQKMNTFSFTQIGDASTLLKKEGIRFFTEQQ